MYIDKKYDKYVVLTATKVNYDCENIYKDFIPEIRYTLYSNGELFIEVIHYINSNETIQTKVHDEDIKSLNKLLAAFDGKTYIQISKRSLAWEFELYHKLYNEYIGKEVIEKTKFNLGCIDNIDTLENLASILENTYNSCNRTIDKKQKGFILKIKTLFKR